jgi:hypothetical protein
MPFCLRFAKRQRQKPSAVLPIRDIRPRMAGMRFLLKGKLLCYSQQFSID